MKARRASPTPFALSLSKGFSSLAPRGEGEGFDRLSPNGFFSLVRLHHPLPESQL